MTEFFQTLSQNKDFMMGTYNFTPLFLAVAVLAVVDLILKAWAMWRSARMNKGYWFLLLLVVNSFGILPLVFLVLTNHAYNEIKLQTMKVNVGPRTDAELLAEIKKGTASKP